MIISQATPDDLDDVAGLLREAARWLESRGIDQWRGGFRRSRIETIIRRRHVFLIRDGDKPIATVTASREGDADFWWPAERAQAAVYISKLAVARHASGHGLGDLLMRWIGDREDRGYKGWLRLDAWRTNTGLQRYYASAGWSHLRTVSLEGRRSGALYQRAAREDLEAREAFSPGHLPPLLADDAPPRALAEAALEAADAWGRLRVGDRVAVRHGAPPAWSQMTTGRVLEFHVYPPSEEAAVGPGCATLNRTCSVIAEGGRLLHGLTADQVRALNDLPRIGRIHS